MGRRKRRRDSGVDADAAVVPAFLAGGEGESGEGDRERESARRRRLRKRAHQSLRP